MDASITTIANIINGILRAVGLFLAWQGGYSLISSKTEHKPDQGQDAWWTLGLGAFCLLTAQSGFITTALNSLDFSLALAAIGL